MADKFDPEHLADDGAELHSGKHRALGTEADALHFRALVGSSTYAIVTMDLDQRLLTWNSGAERLFGASSERMVGQELAVLFTEVDPSLAGLKGRIAEGETVELEARLRHSSGRALDAFITATPTRNPRGEVVGSAAIIRDVTQAKQLERRLRDASQVEIMGRIAAGIAHDINNVLAVIQSYSEFVAAGPLNPEQADDLRLAMDAAKRGAVLTGQLLSLGRTREAPPIARDLNESVRGLEDLLRRALHRGIQFSTELSFAPLQVRTQAGQLDQLLMNLVLNARDAMPEGGKLNVSVRSAVVDSGHRMDGKLRPGAYAVLAVADTGCGMDAETQARIFEPLYTTKAGRGTGLGLSIVQETTRALGGAVEVESTLGQGSIFRVFLPLADQPKSSVLSGQAQVVGGPNTVLIVEEDPVLRSAMQRMLGSSGYHLLLAADPVEAEGALRHHPGRVDVLMADFMQPGARASQLLQQARQLRPQLKVIVLSGQAEHEPGELEADVLVPKPFSAVELLSALERTVQLGSRPSAAPPPKPRLLLVDDDEELRTSLVRLLGEEDVVAEGAKSGLHALQLLQQFDYDVLVTDQFMGGMDGLKLLELVATRYPQIKRVLFTAHAAPDVVVKAVNQGGVVKVLLKNMHPVQIRDDLSAVAFESVKQRALRERPR